MSRSVRDDQEELAAYVVPRAGTYARDPEAQVRQRVAERLAIYKVPRTVTLLESLPRGSMGKVAFERLPEPAPSPGTDHGAGVARGEVARAWAEVLGRSDLPSDRSFFDLGGSSLQLVQLHELLRERLGLELPVTDLFRYPTIAAQSRELGRCESPPTATENRVQRQAAALQRLKFRP